MGLTGAGGTAVDAEGTEDAVAELQVNDAHVWSFVILGAGYHHWGVKNVTARLEDAVQDTMGER
jgi:hypothetical protein